MNPTIKKLGRHTYPEIVLSDDWWCYDPYMGAITGEKWTVGSGRIRHDVCLSKTLKVGDTIPAGMVLHSLPK